MVLTPDTPLQACLLKDHDYLKFCKADVLAKKGFPRSLSDFNFNLGG